jgi:putative CocE/NonD family hydrolase
LLPVIARRNHVSAQIHTPVDILPSSDISPRVPESSIVQHGLLTPMRDGVLLAMDLIRPKAPGAYPVVLVRTPYDKTQNREPFYVELAERGYIVAIQDCRGRFNSDGEFVPYIHEHKDGYDTVEWIAAQPWCDGNIGMAGVSYVGQTQWFAASEAPPHLKCIVPESSPPDAFDNEPITNGCFLLPSGEWMLNMGRRTWQAPPGFEWFAELHDFYQALPLSSLPDRAHTSSTWWDEWMKHPNWDDFWKAHSYQHAWSEMNVPALNHTGWWDMNFPGAPSNFNGMRKHAEAARARDNQYLIIGPWWHHTNEDRVLNGIDFGPSAIINLDHYRIRFYDRHLKGIENGIERDPRVWIFVLGVNEWLSANEWPLPETDFTPFYFHSNGQANSLKGDGGLSPSEPDAETPDDYTYDPLNPSGMLWKLTDGPVDDRLPSIRDDVLCYTSDVIREPVRVVGPVSCVLYASSSARDTDWHVRLVDVYPNGEARFLCHGMLRARFREGMETPVFMEPDEVYRFEFGMDAAGVMFLPGHRIRVEVMSSWWPEYDRNTNSGAANNFTDDRVVVAHNRIYHEFGRASHVVLPVLSEMS